MLLVGAALKKKVLVIEFTFFFWFYVLSHVYGGAKVGESERMWGAKVGFESSLRRRGRKRAKHGVK